ncbi:MAG: sterol desaturase family protein [Gammaproteobacteria bacterium]|nr:sterol desaturase family protein [Gammaproteobacteria bacterium]
MGFLNSEAAVRLFFFLSILGIMILWECVWPRRKDSHQKHSHQKKMDRLGRWPSNFGIVALNAMMLLIVPVTAVEASLFSVFNQFGLLIWLKIPLWPSIIISLLVLDLAIYWQHRIFHLMPHFWRVHRVHHADTAIDVSTGLRFHPIEILLSILIKAVIIIVLGAPILAVIAFEIILNGCAMFNHSNASLPSSVDKVLRYFVVTPDMHRVHHSTHENEHHRNFGFSLSIWDRLFSSYCDQPRDEHLEMGIGLDQFRDSKELRLDRLLTQPFRE